MAHCYAATDVTGGSRAGPVCFDLPETIEGDPASLWTWGPLDPRTVSVEGPAGFPTFNANPAFPPRPRAQGADHD